MYGKFKKKMLNTVGVDFYMKSINVNGKIAKLQLVKQNQFDTPGQEKFKSITATFYKSSSGLIFVFDKSSQESLKLSEQYCEEAKKSASENAVFMIIGNKSDLKPVVSTDQGHEVALRFGAIYLEVSVKYNHNIGNIFEVITSQILDKL